MYIGNVEVNPPLLAAPMAGYTNYAFRQIVREFGGAGLIATEMVNRAMNDGRKADLTMPLHLYGHQ